MFLVLTIFENYKLFNKSLINSISAVTNAVKFPDLSGDPTPDFGLNREGLESEFMATDKQKSYLTELIGNMADEDERDDMMNELSTMSKERASELIQQLKS